MTPIRCVVAVVLMDGETEDEAIKRINDYLKRGWSEHKKGMDGQIGHSPPEAAIDRQTEVVLNELCERLEKTWLVQAYLMACDVLGRTKGPEVDDDTADGH